MINLPSTEDECMKKVILTIVCLLLLSFFFILILEKNDETKQNEPEETKKHLTTPRWIDKQTNRPPFIIRLGDSRSPRIWDRQQCGFV